MFLLFFYKSEKKHVFYVFYLQINVFNIYARKPTRLANKNFTMRLNTCVQDAVDISNVVQITMFLSSFSYNYGLSHVLQTFGEHRKSRRCRSKKFNNFSAVNDNEVLRGVALFCCHE